MKLRFLIILFLYATGLTIVCAQRSSIYLFPDFTNGIVLMKNGARTTAMLNYDANNQNMKFKQGGNILILTNIESVDTIYINKRKFIPARDYLCLECISCEHGIIYVNWSLREKYQGQKGAYGQVSQSANVESINTSYWTNNGYEKESLDVYKLDNNNEYWLKLGGKFINCKSKKTLLKLFSTHKEEIEQFIKEKKIDFSKTEQMINLLNFCLGLE